MIDKKLPKNTCLSLLITDTDATPLLGDLALAVLVLGDLALAMLVLGDTAPARLLAPPGGTAGSLRKIRSLRRRFHKSLLKKDVASLFASFLSGSLCCTKRNPITLI